MFANFRHHLALALVLALAVTLLPFVPPRADAQGDDALPLAQTIVSANGRYAADYPDAPWFAIEDIENGFTITNDESLYTNGSFPPSSGQLAVIVLFPETVGDLNWAPEDTLDDVRANFNPSEITTLFIGGRETVVADLSDANSDFFFYYFRLPGVGLTVVAYATGPGEFEDNAATVVDIIASIRTTADVVALPEPDPNALAVFRDQDAPVATIQEVDFQNLPALENEGTSSNGAVVYNYPARYVSFDNGNIVIIPPDNETAGEIPSGDLAMYVLSEQIDPEFSLFAPANSREGVALQITIFFRLLQTDLAPRNFSPRETFLILSLIHI